MNYRIHTIGASGSGTTTLAKALAEKLNIPQFDADDYFWEKTNPPFTTKCPVEKRLRLLQADLAKQESWTLSGSMVGWGESIIPSFTHVIFLYIPLEIRLERIRARERERYGTRIDPGGDMEKIHKDFMAWAARYDSGGLEVRSKLVHEEWMKQLTCPIIRLEEDLTTEKQVGMVLGKLDK